MRHILVADDNEAVRSFLVSALSQKGYRVTAVENGRKALQATLDDPPDLLIADLVMPVMDGLELMRAGRERWPQVRCIVISGGGEMGRPDLLIIAQALGAFQVLQKPFGLEEGLNNHRLKSVESKVGLKVLTPAKAG